MAFTFEHPLVKEMNDKLKQIDASLQISKIGHTKDKLLCVGLLLPLKGNKDKITKLKDLGFVETYREKGQNGFIQRMEYYYHYRKYAIYRGDVGKYAYDYIDNIFDFKRYGVLGNPYNIEFPIVVNHNGGRHTFHPEYEENFLEIKEVMDGEEPLSREEMFPKNKDDFLYGWIDREGNTYACSFEGHFYAAEYLCEELGIKSTNEERALEDAGWIKISRKAPYTPENKNSRCIYFNSWNCKATQAQIDTLFDLGFEKDDTFQFLLSDMNEEYDR